MRALAFLPLLVGSCVAVPVLAANSSPQASEWLARLAQAERQQSYHGSFIYERNGSFSSHDIWHRVADGSVTERLSRLDGDVQEIVRVNGKVQCATGDLSSEVDGSGSTAPRVLDPLKLMSWYDLSVAGKSRVAGREAVSVSLSPRDQHRYGFDLDLDKETGLPLRSLMINDKGQLLERFQVIRLDTHRPLGVGDLKGGAACKPFKSAPVSAPAAVVGWRSDWLPAGFELVSSAIHRDGQGGQSLSTLMYDDGLARFSVFLEPTASVDGNDIRTQLGPTAAVSRHLVTANGPIMVTVVGEIPLGTAERVALSMRLHEAQARQ
ncbi:MucB/RseB C-terminal domain-containing protein [Pseudomonas sp. RP23018S]|uniref:MucB/RseB C-terminal domain-containing protein n=1 Tax=Pseudomonas sp. RP23018S TaxID=3096037 RepID=UPI002ACA96B4|nr:MucB/RseB C-terminal domain-containing protein [Pseudomonas sp. RP23018S]MDZ5601222.1 MucB/RseB C-terminal domain-containing protein [Pseudomonas sp. RP23018S]